METNFLTILDIHISNRTVGGLKLIWNAKRIGPGVFCILELFAMSQLASAMSRSSDASMKRSKS